MKGIPRRQPRVAIVLSPAMAIALEQLAARNSLTIAAQARLILRQGLDRTIESKPVQDAVKRYNADRGVKSWREDRQIEHEVEMAYAAQTQATE
jgi:hypothetical protein